MRIPETAKLRLEFVRKSHAIWIIPGAGARFGLSCPQQLADGSGGS
jgi:hypothetical protein